MPRSACVPSGISVALVSAATAPEIRTVRPSGRQSPSSRLTRFTAGPIAVKSSRSAAPTLPHRISPRCSATPNDSGGSPCSRRRRIEMRHAGFRGSNRAQRSVAGFARLLADREDREHAVADEFQHLAAKGVDGAADAVEPAAERGDDGGGRLGLGQRGEAAQIGIEQHRPNGLADFAPQRPRQHARGAAPAEIGFERGRQRRARRERGERRCGEAGGLAQSIGFRFREPARPDPAEHRPAFSRANGVFMHRTISEPGQPAPSRIAGRTLRASEIPSARIPPPRSPRRSRPAIARCGGR